MALRAQVYNSCGYPDQYVSLLKQGLTKYPERVFFINSLTSYNEKMKSDSLTLQFLDSLINAKPDNSGYRLNKSRYFSYYSRYEEAVDILKEIINKDSTYQLAYAVMGTTYDKMRKYDKSIPYYEKAIALKSDDTNSMVLLAGDYYEFNRIDEAIDLYKRTVTIDSLDSWAYFLMARAYSLKQGCDSDVVRYYKKAIEINPQKALYHYMFGCEYYDSLKMNDEALEQFRQTIDADSTYNLVYAKLAHIYFAHDMYDKAAEMIGKAIKYSENPIDSTYYFIFAASLVNLKDYDNAISASQSILALYPNYLDVMNCLSVAYRANGQVSEAIDVSNKMLALSPDEPIIYLNLGRCYGILGNNADKEESKQENYKKALAYLEKCKALDPDNQTRWSVSLSEIYQKLGMTQQYEETIKLNKKESSEK